VAEVRLSALAVEDLDRLILTHSLPADTRARVKRSLRALERFPRLGRELENRWRPFRFILGPWRWLLIVYVYDEQDDTVLVATIQDARSSSSATSRGPAR
jgi:plasmid stabilization system protein ParE